MCLSEVSSTCLSFTSSNPSPPALLALPAPPGSIEQNEIHNQHDLQLNEEDYRGQRDLNIDADLLAFCEVQPRVAPAPKMRSLHDIDKENQRPRVNTLSPRATQGLEFATLQDPCNNISQTQTAPT